VPATDDHRLIGIPGLQALPHSGPSGAAAPLGTFMRSCSSHRTERALDEPLAWPLSLRHTSPISHRPFHSPKEIS
jgi:hypothetical protein